jgi:hypothetical protein
MKEMTLIEKILARDLNDYWYNRTPLEKQRVIVEILTGLNGEHECTNEEHWYLEEHMDSL